MVPWIFTHSPLEHWMGDYKRIFDAWEDGGVRGIVFGYLRFMQSDGAAIPTFPPDAKVYADFGVSPPEEAPRDVEKEKLNQRFETFKYK